MSSDQLQPSIEAASTGKLDTLKELLANENKFAEENLSEQPSTHHPDLFSVLLSYDPACINHQFDKRGTRIALACMTKQPLDFWEFLLIAGADPAQNPDCALPPMISVAGFYSDTRVPELLLMNGAHVEDIDQAIEAALKWGNGPIVHFFIERAEEYNARN
ncbi:uncharacterized protein EAF01_011659 [Botrytis porri]|uniref:uncharacterized protein n=1 Tax=Botrytis porri TaxID=87229 RepID=UPI001901EA33|nr:uncharacterized protein EAF01_011659 [Botrytis porri]KAF7883150.1 hypothetical protein EAF01_011659 [Botrytis porri]